METISWTTEPEGGLTIVPWGERISGASWLFTYTFIGPIILWFPDMSTISACIPCKLSSSASNVFQK